MVFIKFLSIALSISYVVTNGQVQGFLRTHYPWQTIEQVQDYATLPDLWTDTGAPDDFEMKKSRRYLYNQVNGCNTNHVQSHCSNNPCVHGTCSETTHHRGYSCHCFFGWTGRNCDQDACHGPKCGTHGVCQLTDTSPFYHCNCSQGYFGQNCEYNFCDVKHCNNGGSCIPLDEHPFFRCLCPSGYTGDTCDVVSMKPSWSQWFYGTCSVTCGNGTVLRIRKCSTGHDEDCDGSSTGTTTCTEKPC